MCDNSRPPQAVHVQTTFVRKGAIELCKWKKKKRERDQRLIWVLTEKKWAIFASESFLKKTSLLETALSLCKQVGWHR